MTDAPSSPQPRLPAAEAPNTTELRRRDAVLTERLASQDAKLDELARELQRLEQERAKTAEVKSRNDEQLSARESAREVAARDADGVAPAKGDEVAGGNDVLPVDNDDDAFGTDFGLCVRAAPATDAPDANIRGARQR